MARRRRRRSRRRNRSSFLPLVFRVVAILLIGFVIYYFTRDSATQKEIATNVSAKISEKTGQVSNAASATLTASQDVVNSAANQTAILVSNNATNNSVVNTPARNTSASGLNNPNLTPQNRKSSGLGFLNRFKHSSSKRAANSATSGNVNPLARVNPSTSVNPSANANRAAILSGAHGSTSGGSFIQPKTGTRRVQQQGPAANQIIDSMMGAYANAKTYSDTGKIHLDYRKQNLPKREVMNFSTAWDRTQGTYRGELFESKVICDGKLLTCYIYDVDTKNFGRQQLVIPVDPSRRTPPLKSLLADDIARSFVSGSQDFPVRNPERGSSNVLLPPAMTLLSRALESPWFSGASTKVRLADEKIGGSDCYCVGIGVNSTTKLFIEKSSSLIRQIEFPKTLLDARLLTSPDVSNVRLYATFPNAQFDNSLPRDGFAVKAQRGATTVRQFVELAQTLPSDYLGKTIRDIKLIDRNGDPFDADDLQGKITSVAWIGHEGWIPLVDQLSQVKRAGYQNFQFGVAYPSSLLSPKSNEVPRPIDELRVKERLGIPLLLDTGAASEQLQLNEFPALLVFDENGKVQFVRSMKDGQWADELKTVLDRLADGEDIAQEMLDGYLAHLGDYDSTLRQVSADDLLRGDAMSAAKPSPRRTPVRDENVKLTPNKKWSQDSFAGPGNILVLPGGAFGDARLAIFDGFQTLNFLDGRGQVVRREKLDIPQNQGVSLVRVSGGRSPMLAVFEKRGSQVHFFDRGMNRVASFPNAEEKHDGILDCSPLGESGKFLLSFNDDHGVYEFDPQTGDAQVFAQTVATKTAVFDRRPVGLINGEVVGLSQGDVLVGNAPGDISAIATADGRDSHLVSTVRTAADQWDAVSYDKDYKTRWSVPLKSQLFNNEVESITGATTDTGETYWAFVDSGDSVCLISDRGTWLGDFQAESAIHGVALAVRGDEVDLVVSTSDKVVCWALNYRAN